MIKPKNDRNLVSREGKWYLDFTFRGKRIRQFGGYTKDQARNTLAKVRIALLDDRLGFNGSESLGAIRLKKKRGTFGEYTRSVLDSAEWKAKRSAERNETSFKNLNRAFGSTPLSDIKPGTVRRYITDRIEKDGAAPASANRELSLLKSILYTAESDELIPSNPIRGRKVKKLEENNKRDKVILGLELTDEKLALLVDGAEDYLKPILRLALTTGMRRNEILCAKWKDFNLTLGTLRIPAEIAKTKRERVVPVDPVLCAEIDSLPRLGEYVFINPETGRRRKDVRGGFEAACKSTGIETGRRHGFVFHDLRHIAAYHLVKTTDIVTAAEILGHADPKMTMRYVHPTDADKHEAVKRVAERLFSTRQKVDIAPETAVQKVVENRIQIH